MQRRAPTPHRHAVATIAGLLFLLVTPIRLRAQEFAVIVNPGNGASEMSAADVAKLFLKRDVKFADGRAAQPVDQPKTSAVRAAFSKGVLEKPVTAIESYWSQQVFAGREVPPAVKPNDDAVIAFVRDNPGAIGYVSVNSNLAGVKRVALH